MVTDRINWGGAADLHNNGALKDAADDSSRQEGFSRPYLHIQGLHSLLMRCCLIPAIMTAQSSDTVTSLCNKCFRYSEHCPYIELS